jgi:hypothetical protein
MALDFARLIETAPEPYGPMVCECPEPQADPRRNFGQCPACKRKPLALMKVTR